nr:hypothetical protein [Tanacetum cinerariifolium]
CGGGVGGHVGGDKRESGGGMMAAVVFAGNSRGGARWRWSGSGGECSGGCGGVIRGGGA